MKKLLLLALLLCGISQAWAAEWTDSNGISWTFTVSGANATNIVPYDKSSISGEVLIPSKVNNGIRDLTVTSIGRSAFSDCSGLTSVTIPEGVSIGMSAFSGCTGLTSVIIPEGVSIGSSAFSGCTGLTSVTFPSTLTNISDFAFQGCTGLTSVTIPSSVTSIGNAAFQNCHMTKVIVPDLSAWCNINFSGDSANPLIYADHLYSDENTEITELMIPNGVITIRHHAFQGCSSLTSITIPESVTSIENVAFNGCSGMTSITIPQSVTSIGSYVFDNCPSLTTVKVSVTDLAAFCNNTIVNLIRNYSTISSKTVIFIDEEGNEITECAIPEGVTSIGSFAFYKCRSLTSLIIPSSVTSIGNNAFYDCSSLASLTIPEGVTSIGNQAFSSCTSLTSVTIPSSMTNIGEKVFESINLTFVTINATNVPSLNNTNSFPSPMVVLVPESALNDYLAADVWKDMTDRITSISPYNDYSATVSAQETSSGIHAAIGEENLNKVISLKISGTINSYDIMVIRNKMLCLRHLDLSDATIVASDYEYVSGCKTEDNKIGNKMFNGLSRFKTIQLPLSVTSIGDYAFSGCSGLTSVTIPEGVTSIGEYAFSRCSGLTNIVLPSTLTGPIRSYCFQGCSGLTEIRIPPMVTSVGSSAFSGCSALKDYYVYVVDPFSIDMGSFANYTTATLHVPTQSYYNYYWNTQWSQFANLVEFDEPYSRFYLQNDYTLADDKRFDGEPDADFHENSGFIVDGNDSQDLGDVHVIGNGTDAASIIDDGNITAQNVFFDITIAANKWYFFAFPFRVKVSDIVAPGYYALRWYDGEARAANGQGGWKDFTGEYLEPGIGYIIQCNAAGTLNIPSTNPTFDGQDKDNTLSMHHSDNGQHASWNFMGNPWLSYFDINDCGFDAPFTIWNGSGYDAYRPGDDDYLLHPFQAFFVQKPEGTGGMHFGHGDRYTYHQGQNHQAAAHAKRMAKGINPQRLMLNLTISDGTKSDRTRVVFNADKQNAYEVGTDAAKFMTADMPQLYTLDGTNTRYAINERPQGEVKLGFNAPTAGTYTIAMQRMDQPMLLRDMLTGRTVSLTDGDYSFDSEAGTFDNRFMLVMDNGTTGIAQLFAETGVSVIGADGGLYISGAEKGEVNVYNTAGSLVAQQAGNGHTALPRGAYIVKVNGVSVKVAVK